MKNSIYEILQDAESIYGLELIETTSESNGYPRNLSYAVTGFKDWNELEEVRDFIQSSINEKCEDIECDVETLHISKRDGWQLWSRQSYNIYKPFDLMQYYAENYTIYTSEDADEEDFIQNEIMDVYSNSDLTFAKLEEIIKNKRELFEQIEELEENEMIVMSDGCYEKKEKQSMYDYNDTKTDAIALTVIER